MELNNQINKDHEKRFLNFQKESGIYGTSEAIQQIFDTIEQVAPSDISVLINGESGTGKELVAKEIHRRSRRANNPLIIVNCGAIPEGIIESELFGHEKGAFTGAVGVRKGFFETADRGTIFLDEIGEMPLSAQVKILRILEGKEFTRVGSSVAKRTNVRVIAATNKSLEQEVQNGNFRQDLFFRLRAITIELPPLRSRKEDIPLLVDKFSQNYCKDNRINFAGFDETAITGMQNYPWAGNIRELKNLVESMIILEKGRKIDEQVLAKYLNTFDQGTRNLPIPVNRPTDQVEREFIYRALIDLKNEISQLRELILTRVFPPKRLKNWEGADATVFSHEDAHVVYDDVSAEAKPIVSIPGMEKKLIEETLSRFSGNKRKAALSLKISERTLYRKIKEYKLPF
ncbi:sigma-54-dependent Fis family transcriptional regulator [candidate division KSB1 bacterium]|nr:sigma-54-dependent Fis family transcriptional regulator [candidate division KSB1 bacterium]